MKQPQSETLQPPNGDPAPVLPAVSNLTDQGKAKGLRLFWD